MLKKLRLGDESAFEEPIRVAKQAYDLAKSIFGERTFITNQALLSYAMTLTKVKSRESEATKLFEKAEKQFTVI